MAKRPSFATRSQATTTTQADNSRPLMTNAHGVPMRGSRMASLRTPFTTAQPRMSSQATTARREIAEARKFVTPNGAIAR